MTGQACGRQGMDVSWRNAARSNESSCSLSTTHRVIRVHAIAHAELLRGSGIQLGVLLPRRGTPQAHPAAAQAGQNDDDEDDEAHRGDGRLKRALW